MIAEFGAEVSAFGRALLQGYNSQQQALLETESTKQLIQAKSLALANIEAFNQGLDGNTDYQHYGDMWNSQKQGLQEILSGVLTLPDAKQKFDEWWLGEQDKQTQYVYGETRKRTVAAAQATAIVAMDQYAISGNEQGILDTAKSAVAGGVFSASEASSSVGQKLPQARYNKLYNDFNKLDPDTAVAQLLASSPETLGVSPDQLKNLTTAMQFKAKSEKDAQAARSEQDGLKSWDEFLTKLNTPDGFTSWADFASYEALVDKGHRQTVRQAIDRAKKDLELGPTLAQDVQRDDLMAQVWDWAATGEATTKPPVTAEQLGTLATDGKIRPEQVAEVTDALKTADAMRDDKETSAMFSRLYGAVDAGKNPALELTIKEIDAAIQDAGKHQAILAKRNELQNTYEKGSGATREDVFYEAYRIANDPYMKEEAKNKWIDDHVVPGGGLSPDDGMKLRGWIKPYNDNPKRKQAMDAIGEAYRLSMGNPNLSTAERKRLANELYNAQNTMDAMFRDPKSTDANIDDAVSSFLTGKAVQDIMDVLSQKTGRAGFPADTAKAGRARELETAREMGVLGQFPKTGAEFATTYQPIALQQEKNALDRAKITFASQAVNAKGDMEYVGSDGIHYVVQETKVDNTMVERVYKVQVKRDSKGNIIDSRYVLVPGQ